MTTENSDNNTGHNPTQGLAALFTQLLDTLSAERTALQSFNGEALDECSAQKHAICRTIDQTLKSQPELTSAIQAAVKTAHDEAPAAELDPDHKILVELAVRARDYNLVNGKILHRSQQSVREILGILSGNSIDGLYGQSGQQTAVPSPGSTAIARA